MKDALKNQLNKLKQNQKTAPTLPYKAQSSLLFDFKYANSIDVETVYEIGYEGLIQLTKIDENFKQFFKTLFNSTSKYYNREMLQESEIKEKDIELKKLLKNLSKYFLNPNTHQVLEYLIKVYKINLYLSEYYILPFLCYYNSNIFIKLIQNLNFKENDEFAFMEENAKNGVQINTDDIIKYFSNATHYEFFTKMIEFYTKNISLDNFDYFSFIINIMIY